MNRKLALLLCAVMMVLCFTACAGGEETTVPTTQEATRPTWAPSDVEELSVIVTEEDIGDLDSYPMLKKLDVSGSTCYAAIWEYIASHPDVEVTYTVSLGGSPISCKTTGLTLEPGTFDYDTVLENLKYLPKVTHVSLPATKLDDAQIDAFTAAYPDIELEYTFEVGGVECGPETTELDLSEFDVTLLDALAEKLPMMENLTYVELSREDSTSPFSIEQVKQLRSAHPNAIFHYVFELFGQTVSTTDTKLDYSNTKLGNEAEAEMRDALAILPANVWIKVENCGFDNEVLGGMQQDFPNATIVWRVWYGKQNGLTDSVMIRHVYNLRDNNCENLKYFTKVKYMDIGHNETLTTIDFCGYMPELEILIASGSSISDISALGNCTKLQWLELTYCAYVTDIAALANCTELKCLNLGFTNVADITPVMEHPIEFMHCILNQIPEEQEKAFDESHPDAITVWRGKQPYGYGWRYVDDGYTFTDYYKKVREVFDLDEVDKRLKAQEAAKKNK